MPPNVVYGLSYEGGGYVLQIFRQFRYNVWEEGADIILDKSFMFFLKEEFTRFCVGSIII